MMLAFSNFSGTLFHFGGQNAAYNREPQDLQFASYHPSLQIASVHTTTFKLFQALSVDDGVPL